MQIYNFELGPIGVNSFLIIPEGADAVLIDAPEGSFEQAQKTLARSGAKIGHVLLTHAHWDHIWDAAKFQSAGAKICAHKDGQALMETPSSQKGYMFGLDGLSPAKIDVFLRDGQTLKFGDLAIEARAVPGHCPGSLAFVVESEKLAFVGDLLFAGSVGRTDFPGGDFSALEKSVREKIYTLPDSVKILPGHGGFTSVGEEKASNPYVRP